MPKAAAIINHTGSRSVLVPAETWVSTNQISPANIYGRRIQQTTRMYKYKFNHICLCTYVTGSFRSIPREEELLWKSFIFSHFGLRLFCLSWTSRMKTSVGSLQVRSWISEMSRFLLLTTSVILLLTDVSKALKMTEANEENCEGE